MKKIILTILFSLCVFLGVCFVACNKEETYVYYGVVQTIEGQEGLYMQIPNVGFCEMPTYEKDKEPNIIFNEGYLVTLEFSSEIQVTKSNPAIIATPARSASVYEDKVVFEITENAYLLTIKPTQQMIDEFLACDSKVNDTVWFQGVLENQAGTTDSPSIETVFEYSATVEEIENDKLSVSLSLDSDMQKFFKSYVEGNLKLQGKSPFVLEEGFCNFLDIQSELQQTDIQKIVRSKTRFKTNTNERIPTLYKTSTNEQDIETVCRWLKYTLVNPIIVEIPYAEVEFDNRYMAELIVYTSRGNFKVKQLSDNVFQIWDKYFRTKGGIREEIPSVKCDKPVYKIDYSTSKTVELYHWETLIDKPNFDLSELTLKETTTPVKSQNYEFFLYTDAGWMEFYSEDVFYLENVGYYEIVGEKDFLAILKNSVEVFDLISMNCEWIKEIYAESDHGHGDYADDLYGSGYTGKCNVVVSAYYGQYESGAIVANVYCNYTIVSVSGCVSESNAGVLKPTIIIGGQPFYGNIEHINVFYEGKRYDLLTAYKNGYLTEEDIKSIAIRRTGSIFEYLTSFVKK